MRKATLFSVLLVFLGLLVIQVGCSKDEDPVTPPPTACKITMVTPKAGDQLSTDNSIKIRWERTTGDNVRIDLYKGGNIAGIIKADHTSTAADGFYSWESPETFGNGTGDDYSIKITSLKNPDCFDQTGNFRIEDLSNCFLKFPWKLDLPDMTAGDEFLISWDSEFTSGFVDLELWLDPYMQAPFKVEDIVLDLEDTGSYNWIVDSYNLGTKTSYFFKIFDVTAQETCTDSSIPFTIVDEANCNVGVGGIDDVKIYTQGEVLTIFFYLEHSSGFVDLELYVGKERVVNGGIVENFNTEGGTLSYDWTVTDKGYIGPPFDAFNIRVIDSIEPNCMGESLKFEIAQ